MDPLPDDAGLTIELLTQLRAKPALVAAAAAALTVGGAGTPAAIENLRKLGPAPLMRAALSLARARQKARDKFGEGAFLWAPPEGIEQASSPLAAAHKATRFAAIGPAAIADLCCGIGSDTLALSQVAPTLAVDLSPLRLWCLTENTGHSPRIQTLEARIDPKLHFMPGHLDAFHIDPSRRSAGKRLHLFADILPGPETVEALIARIPAGATKLSPAVDFESLPAGHIELLSEPSAVTQAILWTGRLAATFAPRTRTATRLRPNHPAFSFTGTPGELPPPGAAPMAYVYEIDPGTHRAGLAPVLAESLALQPMSEDTGYLTGASCIIHPLLTVFEHIETLAYDEKRLTRALANLTGPAGPVEVKTRGRLDIKTDVLQRRLSAAAPAACTLLLYRAGTIRATLCRRVPLGHTGSVC